MADKRITAIIRTDVVDEIETRLHRLGVPGITFTRVEGYGEYTKFWTPNSRSSHMQIEIFSPEDHTQKIVDTILETARTGAAGDGIVAVVPVDKLYRVRDH
jgi:nitrogen regulatory protein P-II 1